MMDLYIYNFDGTANDNRIVNNFKKASVEMKNNNMIPYGNPIITPSKFIQLFVKDKKELNDKFLGLFLEELKYLPGSGSAYQTALERFNENVRPPSPPNSKDKKKSGGGKSKKHRMKHNKKTKKNL